LALEKRSNGKKQKLCEKLHKAGGSLMIPLKMVNPAQDKITRSLSAIRRGRQEPVSVKKCIFFSAIFWFPILKGAPNPGWFARFLDFTPLRERPEGRARIILFLLSLLFKSFGGSGPPMNPS
jgi:hypothetical protein